MATVNPNDAAKQALKEIGETSPLMDLIRKASRSLANALPAHMSPERIAGIYLTCIRQNPKLAQCTPASVVGALYTSVQLGLEPVAGLAYIIPYKNRGVLEAQFQTGYKGIAALFYRHEKAIQLTWGVVREGDFFDYQYGTDQFLKHRPTDSNAGKPTHFYFVAKLANGGTIPYVMTYSQCIEHGKKHSKTYVKDRWDEKTNKYVPLDKPYFVADSTWVKDEESMCLKTVFKVGSKTLPLSIEMQRAIAADETTREFREGIDNALDIPDSTDWNGPAIDTEATPKEQPKTEVAKPEAKPNGKFSPAMQEKIAKARSATGDQFFKDILRKAFGCEDVQQLQNDQEAQKFLDAIDQAWINTHQQA